MAKYMSLDETCKREVKCNGVAINNDVDQCDGHNNKGDTSTCSSKPVLSQFMHYNLDLRKTM